MLTQGIQLRQYKNYLRLRYFVFCATANLDSAAAMKERAETKSNKLS